MGAGAVRRHVGGAHHGRVRAHRATATSASGLLADRPGPARAQPALLRPAGLAWRLGRVVLVAWAAGLFVGGIAYGSIGNDVKDVIGDSEATKDIIAQGTGDVVDLVLGDDRADALPHRHRLRADGHAPPPLRGDRRPGRAAPRHRARPAPLDGRAPRDRVRRRPRSSSRPPARAPGWPTASPSATPARSPGWPPSSLTYTPAVWVMVGSRRRPVRARARGPWSLVWGALAVCRFVGLFAQLLDLPQWVIDLSPFQHVPQRAGDELRRRADRRPHARRPRPHGRRAGRLPATRPDHLTRPSFVGVTVTMTPASSWPVHAVRRPDGQAVDPDGLVDPFG